jgi:sec-independent protein translocase protein TatC
MVVPRGFLALDDPDPKNMTVIEHLEELRSRLLVCVIVLCVTIVGSLFLYQFMLDLLLHPLRPLAPHLLAGDKLVFLKPTDGLFLRIKLALIPGAVFALPVLLYELWMFVAPAFELETRRYVVPFVGLGMVLFLIGATIGYFIFPRYLGFLVGIAGSSVVYLPTANDLLDQFALIVLIFGGVFELPIVLTLLSRVGIISSALLRRNRKVSIFLALFAGMIITPGADPFTPLIVGALLIMLYEFSIILIRMGHR